MVIVFFSIVSFLCTFKVCKQKRYRLPLIFYMSMYFFTSFFGNILFLFYEDSKAISFFDSNAWTYDIGFIVLLFSPFFILPIMIFFVDFIKKYIKIKIVFSKHEKIFQAQQPSLGLCFLCFVSVFCVIYFQDPQALNLFNIKHINYIDSIMQRYSVFSSFGVIGTGLVYTTVPLFSYISLYQMMFLKKGLYRSNWFAMFLSTVFFMFVMTVGVMQQKSIFAVYLISVSLGWAILKNKITINKSILVFIMLAWVIHWYQLRTHLDWSPIETLELMSSRMSRGLYASYYLYSFILSHPGFRIFQRESFTAENVSISESLHRYLSPDSLIDGNVPVPAHFDAYAQSGWLFVLVVFFLTTLVVKYIASLKIKNAFDFAWYMSLFVFLYYLTQISFVLSVLGSYGLIFALVPLRLFTFLHVFLSGKSRLIS